MQPLARLRAAAVAAAVLAVPTTPALAASHHHTFQSPSHNIGCVIFGAQARCDIKHRTWALPPAPKSCNPNIVNFGQGLWIINGKAGIVCAGDTALNPQAPVLAYGKTNTVGRFSCKSTTAGMTCRSTHSGHGFFLSVASYRLF